MRKIRKPNDTAKPRQGRGRKERTMKIIERSTGKTVEEILTNRSMTIEEALEAIGARIDRDTNEALYKDDVYNIDDLTMEY